MDRVTEEEGRIRKVRKRRSIKEVGRDVNKRTTITRGRFVWWRRGREIGKNRDYEKGGGKGLCKGEGRRRYIE